MGLYRQRLDAMISELEQLLESIRNRKREDSEDGKKPGRDDEEQNILTGLIPFVPVAIESLFSGRENTIGVPEGKSRMNNPSGASIAGVIVGWITPQQYVAAVGPIAAIRSARLALKNVNALAKRIGANPFKVRALIVSIITAAQAAGGRA